MLRQHALRARRVVVIGFGPVAARLVEELRPAVRDRRLQVLVVGSEPVPAYNRIMVGELALDRTSTEMMIMADADELGADGIAVRLGTTVTEIDRERRYVTLSGGEQFGYDILVFATGAAARVPELSGLASQQPGEDPHLPPGIAVLRDLADARRVRNLTSGPVVVLGGGVLGMELALAAVDQGVRTTLVHAGQVPMERNLDRTSAAIIARHLRRHEITVIADARASGVRLEQGRFTALTLADGRRVTGAGLVLCCGAEARTTLGRRAGLAIDNGIVVDHELRSITDPAVYAIGDCARVRCFDPSCEPCRNLTAPTGLIATGWAQADRLARQLTGGPAEAIHTTDSPVMILKAPGLSVVSAGNNGADPVDCLDAADDLRVAQWSDPRAGRYAKITTRNGVLDGLICVGLPRTAAELTLLYQRRAELPSDRSALLRHDGPDHVSGSDPLGLDATVCRCNTVTAGQIAAAIDAGHHDLSAIGRATRAGTGCGTCKDRICELLEARTEVALT
jgi:assimilatory nitrate reductase electron transfer subunit